jgi:SAM-dependent methyltransferase
VREFVRNAYRVVLRREPDEEALAWATTELETGALSRAGLVAELAASDEFAALRALDDALSLAARARAQGIRPRELTAPPATDERLIEIPWVLARYAGEPRVVDVGYANAAPAYLEALVAAAPGEVVGLDPVAAEVAGVRAVVGDLRALPFEDASVDVLLCISTIEHVGRDNRVYGSEEEHDESGILDALREIRRVAARALVTVPVGAHEDHGWFVQLPVETWRSLFEHAGLAVAEDELYVLGEDGWRSAHDATGLRYQERGPAASAVYCVELRPFEQTRVGAAAAGAEHDDDPERE